MSVSFLAVCMNMTAGTLKVVFPPAMPLYSRDTLTICVAGDMMMHSAQIENARTTQGYDFSGYFRHLEDRIGKADIAIANMEFTLAGEPHTGYPSFSAPDSYAEYLAECGFDIFLAANNHIYDKGSAGARRTVSIFKELSSTYGIRFCGLAENHEDLEASTPLVVIAKGIRIALINFTYGTNLGSGSRWPKVNYMNEKTLIEQALRKSEETDLTLVLPHWGTEYSLNHSQQQEDTALWLAENGADVIIGTHPHVPQDFETLTRREVPVVYSLGNAVSNMSAPNTQLGLMTTIRIVREPDGDTEVLPIQFTYTWCSRPGGYCSSYTVLPVKEFIGRKEQWQNGTDYDRMLSTYQRVKKTIGIEDN